MHIHLHLPLSPWPRDGLAFARAAAASLLLVIQLGKLDRPDVGLGVVRDGAGRCMHACCTERASGEKWRIAVLVSLMPWKDQLPRIGCHRAMHTWSGCAAWPEELWEMMCPQAQLGQQLLRLARQVDALEGRFAAAMGHRPPAAAAAARDVTERLTVLEKALHPTSAGAQQP